MAMPTGSPMPSASVTAYLRYNDDGKQVWKLNMARSGATTLRSAQVQYRATCGTVGYHSRLRGRDALAFRVPLKFFA